MGAALTLGIIGGGQLGRMTALAAARLGVRTHIFTPEANSPASLVSARTTVAPYNDLEALETFALDANVITLEFENIPAPTLAFLSERRPVRPHARALEISQDRRLEKDFFRSLGIETAPWFPVESPQDLHQALKTLGTPAILKTARLGYDGKGQVRLTPDSDVHAAWDAVGAVPCILEGRIEFQGEISALAARTPRGKTAVYDPAFNVHEDGILRTSTVPATGLPPGVLDQAQDTVRRLVGALDLVGLLAVEFFVTKAGTLLANEMAPRPHNSAHWTMDGAHTDQFEQLVRAVLDLPLGSPACFRPVRMVNLIGDDMDDVPRWLATPGVGVHLYGKNSCRPGRKMGHVNVPL